jgi:hypothetical protein
VLGGADRAGNLIDGHHRDPVVGPRLHRHQRHVGVGVRHCVAGLLVGGDHEDPVDSLAAKPLDRGSVEVVSSAWRGRDTAL